jgi:EpsD family peptidyl-prolyl cis-trans isomerase
VLAACTPPGERAAARVNGVAILHEEVELVRQGGVRADGVPARRVVEGLIVKELLAQQFLRTARDSASVAESAVNVARRELLAQRHVAAIAARVAPPDAAQVRAFYRAHPALFAKRRAFMLRTLDIVAPPAREAELQERVRAAASLDQLAQWLRKAGLRFAWSEAERTSDELAPGGLSQLAAMRAMAVAVLPTPTGLRVVQLVRSRPAGLDERAARPLIEQRLWAQKRAAAVDAEVRLLSQLAAISITDGEPSGGNGTLTSLPDELPAVLPRSAPKGPMTGGAPGGGNTP